MRRVMITDSFKKSGGSICYEKFKKWLDITSVGFGRNCARRIRRQSGCWCTWAVLAGLWTVIWAGESDHLVTWTFGSDLWSDHQSDYCQYHWDDSCDFCLSLDIDCKKENTKKDN